jgi:phosphoenolpyruvate-protein phosphotransferase (PTS system enzyme I)
MIILKGIPASPGIAIGKAFVLPDDDLEVKKITVSKEEVKQEIKRFKDAVKFTYIALDEAENKVLHMLGKNHAKLIDAHKLILKDPLITQEVPQIIAKEKVNAEYALSKSLEKVSKSFEKIQDAFFRERRHDLFDVGKRLMRSLTKQENRSFKDIRENSIVVSRNLYPSDTIRLRETKVQAFCTDIGGKTSHTALFAQSMKLPSVVGLSDVTKQVANDDVIIVDGDQGIVIVSPNQDALLKYQKAQKTQKQSEKNLGTLRNLPSITKDGHKIELVVNMDVMEDSRSALSVLPEGIGLLRTESLYMNRVSPPTEEEHYARYSNIAKSFSHVFVTMRLADFGGDKLTKLNIPGHEKEDNPFLGLRGVRVLLRYPELLRAQLKAMLRASLLGKIKIMIPMVSSVEEVCKVKKIMEEISIELKTEGIQPKENIELGIMIEVPSAALTLDTMLGDIDFVSIGTNDLIQYLLAVDRINQNVAHIYDGYHPAVLRTLHLIIQTAHKKGKKASICGEIASDVNAVPLLIGLGVDSLSVPPRMFLRIKNAIRSLNFKECTQTAQTALTLSSSDDVRNIISVERNENT